MLRFNFKPSHVNGSLWQMFVKFALSACLIRVILNKLKGLRFLLLNFIFSSLLEILHFKAYFKEKKSIFCFAFYIAWISPLVCIIEYDKGLTLEKYATWKSIGFFKKKKKEFSSVGIFKSLLIFSFQRMLPISEGV